MKNIKLIVATTVITGIIFIGGTAYGAFSLPSIVGGKSTQIDTVPKVEKTEREIEEKKAQEEWVKAEQLMPETFGVAPSTFEERLYSLELRVAELEANQR
jgi:hypothetical protein